MSECVKVAVRCRPLSQKEKDKSEQQIVQVDNKYSEISISNPSKPGEAKRFTFDFTYSPNCSQKDLYDQCAFDLVESVIQGYNGTIFAYGQTGTGKTHTMIGLKTEEDKGIIPRTFEHIFKIIQSTENTDFLVSCSMLEIYNEEIRDLLSSNTKKKLKLGEKQGEGFFAKDLSLIDMHSSAECLKMLNMGSSKRTTIDTNMNDTSSRSHCIFTLVIETSRYCEDGRKDIRRGKLNLVDLAGSERQKKTGATGQTLIEGTNINLSLIYLGKVISSLVNGEKHIPYRDSNLTKLLQDSLGGNTKTIMIANIGPAQSNFDESMSTLRYANQAKNIKCKPKINQDPKDAKLREIQDEISKLKETLALLMKRDGNIDLSKLNNLGIKEMTEEINNRLKDEYAKEKEKYNKKLNDIYESKKITEKERETLLIKHKEEEQKLENQRKEKEDIFKKMKKMEEKVLKRDQDKKEFEKIRLEIEKKRELNEKRKKQKEIIEKETKEAEVEKFNLQKKYITQQEELSEKEEICRKLKARQAIIRDEYNELKESYEAQINSLKEELNKFKEQNKINETIISAYFREEEIKIIEDYLVYDERNDAYDFKFSKEMMEFSEDIKNNFNEIEKNKMLCDTNFNTLSVDNDLNVLFDTDNFIKDKVNIKFDYN